MHVWKLAGLGSLVALGSLGAQARTGRSPAVQEFVSVEAPVVALTRVRVVDGTGAAARDDQTVIIRGGTIEAVGPAASVKAPRGAKVIDGAGHTVIPGLIGLHDHTFPPPGEPSSRTIRLPGCTSRPASRPSGRQGPSNRTRSSISRRKSMRARSPGRTSS